MSLMIGSYIDFALKRDAALTAATDGRVWPVLAPEDREHELPYVTYAMDALEEEDTKDGVCCDHVTAEVLVVAASAEESERVAHLVRLAMAKGPCAWNAGDHPFRVSGQEMRAGGEDFDLAHDSFFLPMSYQIETEGCVKTNI